ncbi:DUF397 domain-containing protein [Thermomonospora cellulosilytica]|uniref:DUF397 domain-containing protein n=1 Tax=Thermomonospora cellulosilytica TaxID=1411118 RepID=A0A7W3N591_9ACTN|nr:DUF397 domain-containing protein [Thermomonospora cellulosilytica]MBA9007793.1 hypothetical protein [Thermomonospora cellulosilytica]
MTTPECSTVPWRKSTYSDGGGCVEVALATVPGTDGVERDTIRLVRDSKNPELGVLRLTARSWAALINGIKNH